MLCELVAEFRPAARILVLILHAGRTERVGFRRLGHSEGFETARRGFRLVDELLAFVALGTIAASGDYQRASARRIGETEMQRGESPHRQADDMRALEFEPVKH